MKRRFEFRLARVRRVRELEERVARGVWSVAERAARTAEDELEERRRAVQAAREELLASARDEGGALRPGAVVQGHRAIEVLLGGVHRHRELARTARDQAERLAEAWRRRRVDRRALEQLEERARARHRAEVERLENAALDERAGARRPGAPGAHRVLPEAGPRPGAPAAGYRSSREEAEAE